MLLPLILTFPPRGDKQFYIVIMHKIWLCELVFHLVCTGMHRDTQNCLYALQPGWAFSLNFEPVIYLHNNSPCNVLSDWKSNTPQWLPFSQSTVCVQMCVGSSCLCGLAISGEGTFLCPKRFIGRDLPSFKNIGKHSEGFLQDSDERIYALHYKNLKAYGQAWLHCSLKPYLFDAGGKHLLASICHVWRALGLHMQQNEVAMRSQNAEVEWTLPLVRILLLNALPGLNAPSLQLES